MVAFIEAARAEGYRTHSAKVGGSEPAADIARIEAVEAARRPDEFITYDVNRAWTPALAIEVIQRSRANVIDTIAEVNAILEEERAYWPAGMKTVASRD